MRRLQNVNIIMIILLKLYKSADNLILIPKVKITKSEIKISLIFY